MIRNSQRAEIGVRPALEILYVGSRHLDEIEDIASRGAVVQPVPNVYEGITELRRKAVGATVVEYGELAPDPVSAVEALREAAEGRPLLFSMTMDEWEELRRDGLVSQEEVLVRPYYPDELWRRVTRVALPPAEAAVFNLRNDADRLGALIRDAQQMTRCTNNLPNLGTEIMRILKKRMNAARVSVFFRGREEGELSMMDAAGLPPDVREDAIMRLGEGVGGGLAEKGEVAVVRKAGDDGPAAGRTYGSDSYMIVPLVFGGGVVAVLCVTERLRSGPFTRADVAYMRSFAETAAPIVQNALQYRTADELATIDELTQLFNRRYFNRILPQEVERARRYGHDLTLVMIDLDRFKQYNDHHGHQQGDAALARVAQILRDSFREADIPVRYGGEEFAVIMPETSRKEGNGVEFVHRARERVKAAGLVFEDEDGRERPLTISGGVATYPLQAKDWEELLRRADEALFRAKAQGRDNIVGF